MYKKYRWTNMVVSIFLGIVFLYSLGHTQDHRAVIINGNPPFIEPGGNTIEEDEFWNDVYRLWEMLYCIGMPDSNIYVLFADGQDYIRELYPDTHYVASRYGLDHITDFSAHYSDVDNIFHWLAHGSVQHNIAPMTVNDNLFIYTFNHGSGPYGPEENVKLLLYEEPEIWDTTFARLADMITYNKRVVWMNQCSSGGFANELTNDKTIFTSATQIGEIGHPIDNIPDWENEPNYLDPTGVDSFDHGEFSYHIMNAVWEETPMGAPIDADYNYNHTISFWEAYEWERTHESTAETPVHTDAGGFGDDFSMANFAVLITSTDSLALAYNGNRHLVRAPNTEQLHIVYAHRKKIWYRASSDGGASWDVPVTVGKGSSPSICLNTSGCAVAAWTDDEGSLWYGNQSPSGDWSTYELYNPSPYDPYLNTPPSIVVTGSFMGDTVHILTSLYLEDIEHLFGAVAEYTFPINNPSVYTVKYIEGGLAPNHKFCYNPSLTKDYQNRLHAVWQRSDTICYATREVNQQWINSGPTFLQQGLNSAHPFVEIYGDRVFVTWQHQETSGKDDVYKGWRYLDWPDWRWENLSLTATESQYAVNASGLVTTFVDEEVPPPPDGGYEVYWKRTPTDPLNNISETPKINSMYPQTSLRYNQNTENELFVVWQEGNKLRYVMKFKKIYVPDTVLAFFSSLNGNPQPSTYVINRDTFNDTWAVPVDIGNNILRYQFYLEPGYSYRAKTTAYHEYGGLCKARLKVDNTLEYLVQYNTGIPKSLDAWIPAQLYEDSFIEVSFEKITGAAVTLGPIYIYRYEDGAVPGPPGGIMAYSEDDFIESSIDVVPTVFTRDLSIQLQTDRNIDVTAHIYDVTGRLVYDFGSWSTNKNCVVRWSGEDNMGRQAAPGIYFVQVKNIHTDQRHCFKVLKIR